MNTAWMVRWMDERVDTGVSHFGVMIAMFYDG